MSTIDMSTIVIPESEYEDLKDDRELLDFIIYTYMDQRTFEEALVAFDKEQKKLREGRPVAGSA